MAFSNSLFQLADAPFGTGAANALQCRTGLDISYGLIWPSQINLNISTRFVKNSTFQNSQGKITQMCLQYLPPPMLALYKQVIPQNSHPNLEEKR